MIAFAAALWGEIMGRFGQLLTGLVLWLVATTAPSSAVDYTKPGPYAVGLRKFTIPESSDSHSMPAMIWYPAAGPAPDPTAELSVTSDTPAATTGPFPLVVVIQGANISPLVLGTLGRRFASHGLAVAAADLDTGPLDGGGDWQDQHSSWLLYDRPANVVRVIRYADMLTAQGGTLAGVIDTSRIGVWGLSTGGSTAFQAAGAQVDLKALDTWCIDKTADEKATESCQFVGHEQAVATRYGVSEPFAAPLPPIWDSRVAVLVAAAPGGELHAFGDKGIAAIKLPTLIMFASDDNVVSPEFNALWAYEGIGSPTKVLAMFDRGGHTFSVNSRSPIFNQATALATSFLLAILKDNPADEAKLIQNAVSFPGLTYRTTLK
ncbi:alpha/beta hydrolase family protein [Tabrizicola sp. BL-A-41-H6]|uniref:alpha/beta hydrolase family protein n=1 Tax=Tabrizicola sp. BL-A-41-H6 TaxID=3421107 RepID=UPI003D677A82